MGKHILLAFATSKYEHFPESFQRTILSEVRTSIVDLFTKKLKVYNRELEAIGENPSKSDLETNLNAWFKSEQRDSSDWVVLYYTGHARVIGADSLYLLTSNTIPNDVSITAYSLRGLADMLLEDRGSGRPRRPGRMLIIIDTCFAGIGAIKLASDFREMLARYSRNEIYVLSATLPTEEAQAGALAHALIGAIEELSTRSLVPQYFSVEDVMEQINERLKEINQEALCIPAMITGATCFFPNPSFEETGGKSVFANEAQRAILDQEFRDHWGPRSRGVEFDTQHGDYFSGRETALSAIRTYLSGPASSRPLVITGKAGAGKSAILSRVVAQSRDKSSGISTLDVAVHAKGKRLSDVVSQIAAEIAVKAYTIPPKVGPKQILNALAESGKTARIVLDALDEAAEPDAIAEALLRPLGETGRVSLLIGSRQNCVPLLGDVDVLDIDLPQYARDADIADYARRRLLRVDELNTPTPYAGKEELAEVAAAMIAKRADKNFLVARLLVENLLLRPQPIDAATSAKMALPATVAVAFDAYLSRFGAKETTVRDLLRPLAYAEGKGVPWGNIWGRVASHLSERTYNNDDIRWLLRNAGAFILESLQDGQAVYRLYHLALQEALRSREDDRSVQVRLTEALMAAVPRSADGAGNDWLLANRYIRRYLPAHAAAAGKFDELLLDAMFVIAAIPSGLLPALQAAGSKEALQVSRIYKTAAHHWDPNGSPGTWASYLEFTARKLSLDYCAGRFGALNIWRQWRIPWVSLKPSSTHRVLRGHEGPVRAVVLREDLVVSASDDGTIRSWDLETGELRCEPFRGHDGAIHALSVGAVNNCEIVVSAGEDSTVRMWLLQTGQEIMPPMRGHKGAVRAILLTEFGGDSIVISGGHDGIVRLWNAATGELIQPAIQAHAQQIRALALCNVEGALVLISTGDSGSIRVWDAQSAKLIAEARSSNVVNALVCFELEGKTVVASANDNGCIEIWDPCTMTPSCASIKVGYSSIFSLAELRFHGNPVLITGDVSGVIKLMNTEIQEPFGNAITEHDAGVWSIAPHPSRAFIASGGLDRTVRLWDLQEAESGDQQSAFGEDSEVLNIAVCRSIAVARSYDRRIRFFDFSTGELLGKISSGTKSFERAIALTDGVDGPMLAFDMSGVIFFQDLSKPSSEMFPLGSLGGKAHDLLFHTDSSTHVLTAVSGTGRIKSWNATDKKVIRELEIDLHRGWQGLQEKWSDKLALGTLGDGRVVLLSGGSGSGLLRVWNSETGELLREIPVAKREHAWTSANSIGTGKLQGEVWTTGVAVAEIDGRQWIASGNSGGTLEIWDAKSYELIASLPGEASIYALRIASIAGRPAVVWGGRDHVLHAWRPETSQRESIDVGFPVNAIAVAPDETVIAGTGHGLIAVRFEI